MIEELNTNQNDDFQEIDFASIETTSLSGSGGSNTNDKQSSEKAKGEEKGEDEYEIDPNLAIFVFDSLMTRVIVMAGKQFGYVTTPKNLALTAAEIKRIRPLAEKSLRSFLGWFQERFPDHFALILTLIVIYGAKFMQTAVKVEQKKVEATKRGVTAKSKIESDIEAEAEPKPRKRRSVTTKNIRK